MIAIENSIIAYIAAWNRVPLASEYDGIKNKYTTKQELFYALSQMSEANAVGKGFPNPRTYTSEYGSALKDLYDYNAGEGIWGNSSFIWKGTLYNATFDARDFTDFQWARLVYIADYTVAIWRNMFGSNAVAKAITVDADYHLASTIMYILSAVEKKSSYTDWETNDKTVANLPFDIVEALYAEGSDWENNAILAVAFQEFTDAVDRISQLTGVLDNVISTGTTLIGTQQQADSDAEYNSVYLEASLTGDWQVGTSKYTITLNDAYSVLSDIDDTQGSVDVFLTKIALPSVNYGAEYIAAYNLLVEKAISSSNAPLNILFTMVDGASSSEISVKEKLSIKKNALMQIISTVTTQAQQAAMQLVDKKYKFRYEVEAAQAAAVDAKQKAIMTVAQTTALEQQVIDNRRIRAIDSLGDTYGTMMAGGLVPNEAMWTEYFRLVKELTKNSLESSKLATFIGSWSPHGPETADGTLYRYQEPCSTVGVDLTNTVSNDGVTPSAGGSVRNSKGEYLSNDYRTSDYKQVGNFWFVDLSNWNVTNPVDYETSGESPTDLPYRLCSISLDGINYWKHGDIVYVSEVEDIFTEGSTTPKVLYKRMSGYSSGSSVTVAPETITAENSVGY